MPKRQSNEPKPKKQEREDIFQDKAEKLLDDFLGLELDGQGQVTKVDIGKLQSGFEQSYQEWQTELEGWNESSGAVRPEFKLQRKNYLADRTIEQWVDQYCGSFSSDEKKEDFKTVVKFCIGERLRLLEKQLIKKLKAFCLEEITKLSSDLDELKADISKLDDPAEQEKFIEELKELGLADPKTIEEINTVGGESHQTLNKIIHSTQGSLKGFQILKSKVVTALADMATRQEARKQAEAAQEQAKVGIKDKTSARSYQTVEKGLREKKREKKVEGEDKTLEVEGEDKTKEVEGEDKTLEKRFDDFIKEHIGRLCEVELKGKPGKEKPVDTKMDKKEKPVDTKMGRKELEKLRDEFNEKFGPELKEVLGQGLEDSRFKLACDQLWLELLDGFYDRLEWVLRAKDRAERADKGEQPRPAKPDQGLKTRAWDGTKEVARDVWHDIKSTKTIKTAGGTMLYQFLRKQVYAGTGWNKFIYISRFFGDASAAAGQYFVFGTTDLVKKQIKCWNKGRALVKEFNKLPRTDKESILRGDYSAGEYTTSTLPGRKGLLDSMGDDFFTALTAEKRNQLIAEKWNQKEHIDNFFAAYPKLADLEESELKDNFKKFLDLTSQMPVAIKPEEKLALAQERQKLVKNNPKIVELIIPAFLEFNALEVAKEIKGSMFGRDEDSRKPFSADDWQEPDYGDVSTKAARAQLFAEQGLKRGIVDAIEAKISQDKVEGNQNTCLEIIRKINPHLGDVRARDNRQKLFKKNSLDNELAALIEARIQEEEAENQQDICSSIIQETIKQRDQMINAEVTLQIGSEADFFLGQMVVQEKAKELANEAKKNLAWYDRIISSRLYKGFEDTYRRYVVGEDFDPSRMSAAETAGGRGVTWAKGLAGSFLWGGVSGVIGAYLDNSCGGAGIYFGGKRMLSSLRQEIAKEQGGGKQMLSPYQAETALDNFISRAKTAGQNPDLDEAIDQAVKEAVAVKNLPGTKELQRQRLDRKLNELRQQQDIRNSKRIVPGLEDSTNNQLEKSIQDCVNKFNIQEKAGRDEAVARLKKTKEAKSIIRQGKYLANKVFKERKGGKMIIKAILKGAATGIIASLTSSAYAREEDRFVADVENLAVEIETVASGAYHWAEGVAEAGEDQPTEIHRILGPRESTSAGKDEGAGTLGTIIDMAKQAASTATLGIYTPEQAGQSPETQKALEDFNKAAHKMGRLSEATGDSDALSNGLAEIYKAEHGNTINQDNFNKFTDIIDGEDNKLSIQDLQAWGLLDSERNFQMGMLPAIDGVIKKEITLGATAEGKELFLRICALDGLDSRDVQSFFSIIYDNNKPETIQQIEQAWEHISHLAPDPETQSALVTKLTADCQGNKQIILEDLQAVEKAVEVLATNHLEALTQRFINYISSANNLAPIKFEADGLRLDIEMINKNIDAAVTSTGIEPGKGTILTREQLLPKLLENYFDGNWTNSSSMEYWIKDEIGAYLQEKTPYEISFQTHGVIKNNADAFLALALQGVNDDSKITVNEKIIARAVSVDLENIFSNNRCHGVYQGINVEATRQSGILSQAPDGHGLVVNDPEGLQKIINNLVEQVKVTEETITTYGPEIDRLGKDYRALNDVNLRTGNIDRGRVTTEEKYAPKPEAPLEESIKAVEPPPPPEPTPARGWEHSKDDTIATKETKADAFLGLPANALLEGIIIRELDQLSNSKFDGQTDYWIIKDGDKEVPFNHRPTQVEVVEAVIEHRCGIDESDYSQVTKVDPYPDGGLKVTLEFGDDKETMVFGLNPDGTTIDRMWVGSHQETERVLRTPVTFSELKILGDEADEADEDGGDDDDEAKAVMGHLKELGQDLEEIIFLEGLEGKKGTEEIAKVLTQDASGNFTVLIKDQAGNAVLNPHFLNFIEQANLHDPEIRQVLKEHQNIVETMFGVSGISGEKLGEALACLDPKDSSEFLKHILINKESIVITNLNQVIDSLNPAELKVLLGKGDDIILGWIVEDKSLSADIKAKILVNLPESVVTKYLKDNLDSLPLAVIINAVEPSDYRELFRHCDNKTIAEFIINSTLLNEEAGAKIFTHLLRDSYDRAEKVTLELFKARSSTLSNIFSEMEHDDFIHLRPYDWKDETLVKLMASGEMPINAKVEFLTIIASTKAVGIINAMAEAKDGSQLGALVEIMNEDKIAADYKSLIHRCSADSAEKLLLAGLKHETEFVLNLSPKQVGEIIADAVEPENSGLLDKVVSILNQGKLDLTKIDVSITAGTLTKLATYWLEQYSDEGKVIALLNAFSSNAKVVIIEELVGQGNNDLAKNFFNQLPSDTQALVVNQADKETKKVLGYGGK